MVLPFFQKITDLATKIQDLKREHTALSDEVKLTMNFFPDPAVLDTIQLPSEPFVLITHNYFLTSLLSLIVICCFWISKSISFIGIALVCFLITHFITAVCYDCA